MRDGPSNQWETIDQFQARESFITPNVGKLLRKICILRVFEVRVKILSGKCFFKEKITVCLCNNVHWSVNSTLYSVYKIRNPQNLQITQTIIMEQFTITFVLI